LKERLYRDRQNKKGSELEAFAAFLNPYGLSDHYVSE